MALSECYLTKAIHCTITLQLCVVYVYVCVYARAYKYTTRTRAGACAPRISMCNRIIFRKGKSNIHKMTEGRI